MQKEIRRMRNAITLNLSPYSIKYSLLFFRYPYHQSMPIQVNICFSVFYGSHLSFILISYQSALSQLSQFLLKVTMTTIVTVIFIATFISPCLSLNTSIISFLEHNPTLQPQLLRLIILANQLDHKLILCLLSKILFQYQIKIYKSQQLIRLLLTYNYIVQDQIIQKVKYMEQKIKSIYQMGKQYSQKLTITFLVLCIVMASASISFVSIMPNLFQVEDLASFIQIEDTECQLFEQSLKKYFVYLEVQIKLLLALSSINLIFLLILFLFLKVITPIIKTKKPQTCIIFFLFLFAMAFTGRCNSLKLKIQDLSACHNDPHSFSVLVTSSDGIYTIAWLNLVFTFLLMIFSLEYLDHDLEMDNKIKIRSYQGQAGQPMGLQKVSLSNSQRPLQSKQLEDLSEKVSDPYIRGKQLKNREKIIL